MPSNRSIEEAKAIVNVELSGLPAKEGITTAVAEALDKAFSEGCEYERMVARLEKIRRDAVPEGK